MGITIIGEDKIGVCLGNSNVDPIPQFQVGDVVHLKGAMYPMMTLEQISTLMSGKKVVSTVWFTAPGELKRECFDSDVLMKKVD